MVEPKLPKLPTWVRFPSPAPLFQPFSPVDSSDDQQALKGRVVRRKVEAPPSRPIFEIVSRVPIVGRFAKKATRPPKPVPASAVATFVGLPRRLLSAFRPARPPPPPARSIPFVSPVVRRVRQPLASTARMVQAAREARKPKSRWTRMRDATRLLVDGGGASRIERLAGIGMAITGRSPKAEAAPRSRIARLLRRHPDVPAPIAKKGVRALLTGWAAPVKGTTKARAKPKR